MKFHFFGVTVLSKPSSYSVLRATTGSFFAALLDGIMPEKSVSTTLMSTSVAATDKGR